ncbi:hypothetical protein Pst134EB_004308 [Puccinia striiformis f. sp. tritici]|nr:hypothetical protein Pst134EB_004308 [Puccinia striiformis f. sp. tritici]
MKPTILCSAAIMIQGAYCESEAPFVCKNNPAKTKPWCARYHKGVAGGASPYYELTPTKGKPKDGNPACPDLATCCKPNFTPGDGKFNDEQYNFFCKNLSRNAEQSNLKHWGNSERGMGHSISDNVNYNGHGSPPGLVRRGGNTVISARLRVRSTPPLSS